MTCCPDSLEISKELDQQNKMLENVNADFEEAIGGLDAVTKKTQELIKKSGEGHVDVPLLSQWIDLNGAAARVQMARARKWELKTRKRFFCQCGYR